MKGVEERKGGAQGAAGSLEYLIERVLDIATMPAALIYLYACRAEDDGEGEERPPGPRLLRDEERDDQPMWGVDDYADAG